MYWQFERKMDQWDRSRLRYGSETFKQRLVPRHSSDFTRHLDDVLDEPNELVCQMNFMTRSLAY